MADRQKKPTRKRPRRAPSRLQDDAAEQLNAAEEERMLKIALRRSLHQTTTKKNKQHNKSLDPSRTPAEGAPSASNGSRAIPEAPVFRPTNADMENGEWFESVVRPQIEDFGIGVVVPPHAWVEEHTQRLDLGIGEWFPCISAGQAAPGKHARRAISSSALSSPLTAAVRHHDNDCAPQNTMHGVVGAVAPRTPTSASSGPTSTTACGGGVSPSFSSLFFTKRQSLRGLLLGRDMVEGQCYTPQTFAHMANAFFNEWVAKRHPGLLGSGPRSPQVCFATSFCTRINHCVCVWARVCVCE